MKYYLVNVRFQENSREYAYISGDESIETGDKVLVPVGYDNEEKEAVVSGTAYVTEETAPYPVEKMKRVLKKISGNNTGSAVKKEGAAGSDTPGAGMNAVIEEAIRHKISEWTDPETNNCIAPPEEIETYKEMVLQGVEKGWPEALEALAYASYGGNNVFPEDWKKSEECLLKLIEDGDYPLPFYYNTLGYIYYYGRTTGGKPQYEKAFQYFSVAAIYGIYEATYKLADMLMEGKGVIKSVPAAVKLIENVYADNRQLFEDEVFDCKFADVALRLGNIYENGIGKEQDLETAYSLYLQAQYAIRERRNVTDYYGDGKVEKNIGTALERCRKKLPEDFFQESIFAEHPYMIMSLMNDSEGLDMTAREVDGVWYLLARRSDANEDGEIRKHLFTLPALNLCQLSDTAIMRIEDAREVICFAQTDSVYVNHITWSEHERAWLFMYQDYPMIRVKCKGFTFEQ